MELTKNKRTSKPVHIVFLHLDLGIGGAEQLIINLALASAPDSSSSENDSDSDPSLNARVSIFTTHCDQSHCFDVVRKHPTKSGRLADSVHLVGTFLPVTLFRSGTALCSTIRMVYLSLVAKWMYPDADAFVLDVLPTPIPYLIFGRRGGVKSVIFYCHFPDKLLTRDTVNGISIAVTNSKQFSLKTFLQSQYRKLLDTIEEWSMSFADLILVNSNFTKSEALRVFPTLAKKCLYNYDDTVAKDAHTNEKGYIQVLYPAIDLKKFIPPNFAEKQNLPRRRSACGDIATFCPIVSLNRFERKKNIEVLLQAYAKLHQTINLKGSSSIPSLIIAGGYDPRNVENVEYLRELQSQAESLNIDEFTIFRPSISDNERASLLQSALCVVYTPYREHFGIVPLEAMYAGSAVVAFKSGGPIETVLADETGILIDIEDSGENLHRILARVLIELVRNPEKAIEMGRKGHEHVKKNFGLKNFTRKWKDVVEKEAIPRGEHRRMKEAHANSRFQKLAIISLLPLIYILYCWMTQFNLISSNH